MAAFDVNNDIINNIFPVQNADKAIPMPNDQQIVNDITTNTISAISGTAQFLTTQGQVKDPVCIMFRLILFKLKI